MKKLISSLIFLGITSTLVSTAMAAGAIESTEMAISTILASPQLKAEKQKTPELSSRQKLQKLTYKEYPEHTHVALTYWDGQDASKICHVDLLIAMATGEIASSTGCN